ncbi:zinc finger CCCH domain-containing protein 6-like [Ipomoea triloba]|uniref:zinc finger CCCH domain-containing protein 6-like n=1 Tax=Ipomoea triloba TaxID=35885 RepID=UPI00125E588B|nr:zinc finger CCCH domain-containing protein 6-like [Ipomoea triloba]
MPDNLFIAAGEESVELGVQNQRQKGVAEEVYVHPYSIIPPNPSVGLDLEDQSLDDRCIFHVPLVPIEEIELEEGEVLPPCEICASSQPLSTSIHGNPIIPGYGGLKLDPELIAAIVTVVRSAQIDLIDPDLLTMFLSNPQLVEKEMKVLLASSLLATEEIPKPSMAERKPELIALPHAGMPNMAAGWHAKKVIDEYGNIYVGGDPLSRAQCSSSVPISKREHESVGDKPPCKFFNTSKGCWNGSKCRFSHDVDAPYAKRRKA